MDKLSSFFAVIMLAAGIFLTLKTGFFQFTHMGKSIKTALNFGQKKMEKHHDGITPFQALATALGGSIGTANIAGVAGAIAIGGAGTIFWMWVAALFGMGVKYSEIVLALKYRRKCGNSFEGGAMLYIEEGLGKKNGLIGRISKPLAFSFAIFGLLSSLIGTTLVQSNTIAMSMLDSSHIFFKTADTSLVRLTSGILTAVLVGIVIIGGLKRISKASEIIVPFMAIAYIVFCLIILISFRQNIIPSFISIFKSAFGIKQAAGGLMGYGFIRAFRIGTARGVYSNEAGVGSAPMAHAQASVTDPVKQGMYGIFEVFADTIVMCTMTALVVLASGIDIPYGIEQVSGTEIAFRAFSTVIPEKATSIFLTAATLLFAYTSILGWSVYGIQCSAYIFGERSRIPFCILYTAFNVLGALISVDIAWKVGEMLNYLMAVPNLIAVTLLSNEVYKITAQFRKFELKNSRK